MANTHGFQPTDSFQGTLGAAPPQPRGFGVGDIVVLDANLQNPFKGDVTSNWFWPSQLNIKHFHDEFTPGKTNELKGTVDCGSISAAAASGTFKARMAAMMHCNGGVETNSGQTVSLLVTDPHVTDASAKLSLEYLNYKTKMDKVLQSGPCQSEWMTKNSAVVGIVKMSVAGELEYKDSSGATKALFGSISATVPVEGVPVEASASGVAATTAASMMNVKSKSSVFAFSLAYFKVALVDGKFYKKGPTVALKNSSDVRKAASWLKLGDLSKKTKFGRDKNGLKGMDEAAHYVDDLADLGRTWQENNEKALQTAHNSIGLQNPFATLAAFAVTHDPEIVGPLSPADEYIAACTSLENYIDENQDNSMATDDLDRKGSFDASINVILQYGEQMLSNIFEKLKASKGELALGKGWYLKGMRVALEFDPEDVGLVPVSLAPGVVDTNEAPARVFRCLDAGACLLTPVDGISNDKCGNVGRIFGNGGCPDWSFETSVKYLNRRLSNYEATKKGLERDGFTAVDRSPDDIDCDHKKGQVKMIRCILSPPLSDTGSEKTNVVLDTVQETQKKIPSAAAAVSPGRHGNKKQKVDSSIPL